MSFARIIAGLLISWMSVTAAAAQTKMVVGHTGVADYLSLFVAKDAGFFQKNGLDVDLQLVAGGALLPGLVGGSLQASVVPPSSVLLAVDGGLDVVLVAGTAVIDKGDQNTGLVVATGSGIASAKDLAGKKVGVPSVGGFLYVIGRKWIADNGGDPKQVNFVEINFAQMADVLKNGTIQAAITASPFLQRTVQSGAGTVLAYFAASLPPRTAGAYVAMTRDWAKANAGAVASFRKSIREAIAFAESNPEKARAILAQNVKLPPDVLASLPMPRFDPEVTQAQVQFWIDTMSDMGLLSKKPAAASVVLE